MAEPTPNEINAASAILKLVQTDPQVRHNLAVLLMQYGIAAAQKQGSDSQ